MKYEDSADKHERSKATTDIVVRLALTVIIVFLAAGLGHAQGCIVARSTSLGTGPESEGGYLAAKHWQLTVDYRHQYSFRHFIGDVEQVQRQQLGNFVENRINLENFQLTYQATDRWSFDINIPVLEASRRSHNGYYTTYSQGIGDILLSVDRWMWNPKNNPPHNVQFGLGVQMPTGRDDIQNDVITAPGAAPTDVTLDYSIQPGSGGWGILFGVQAFQNLGKQAQFYFNTSYIATPQDTNGVLRNATAASQPLTEYNSISDQYLIEMGVAMPITAVKGLTFTLGPRDEGVPAHDLFGTSFGFRRPGMSISLEPGLVYVRGKNMLSASVGRAIFRDRIRSVPDKLLGTHGDAAFADYVWLASLTRRF
jgi:hypothetical protein